MLAPLEDRSILARDADADADAARRRPARADRRGGRQILALRAGIARLTALCKRQQRQLDDYASGVPIVELGRKLMELDEANRQLRGTALRAVKLERILELSRAECQRLIAERDALARELHRLLAAATAAASR